MALNVKKSVSVLLAALLLLPSAALAEKKENTTVILDGEWKFQYFKNGEIPTDPALNETIHVPAAMELEGYGYPSYYFEESRGWGMPADDNVRSAGVYEKTFDCGKNGERYIVFDSAEDDLTVYLNGVLLGESRNGAIGTVFKGNVKKGKNVLRAYVRRDKSGINKRDNFSLSGITGSVYVTDVMPYGEASARNVETRNGELYIDGEKTVLRGVKYTPTDPFDGDAIGKERIEQDLELIREYGFNAVWVSAAPPVFYEKAAEKGLYVIDEANVCLESFNDAAAKARIIETVRRHRQYESIIMWSLGSGSAGRLDGEIFGEIEKLDGRPVVQRDAVFTADKEIFGNTGGIDEWVLKLGDGNMGGFIKEFADKELYTKRNIYKFETTDNITGKTLTMNGEIKNYRGDMYLGQGSFEYELPEMERFTIAADVSYPEGDRVIFADREKNVSFEVRDYQAYAKVGDGEMSCDFDGGRIALVYADNEAQLFADGKFVANCASDAALKGKYTFCDGDGSTSVGRIAVYNDILTLDQLIEGGGEDKLCSEIDFDDIKVLEDMSYEYLGYGGDFGDDPNSYYKSAKGLFTSLREPHPEAIEIKALFENRGVNKDSILTDSKFNDAEYVKREYVKPVMEESGTAIMESGGTRVTVNSAGEITSFVTGGVESIEEPLRPATARLNTVSELENWDYFEDEYFTTKSFEAKDDKIFVELRSGHDSALYIYYKLRGDGVLHISMQSDFGNDALKPTFIGFKGKTGFDIVKWTGTEESVYPDRISEAEIGTYEKHVADNNDNYAVPQESNNKLAYEYSLFDETGALTFAAQSPDGLWCASWNYDPEEYALHDEDVTAEDGAYIRIGGFIAGIGENEKYKLNDARYGFSMSVSGGRTALSPRAVKRIMIDGAEYKAFSPDVKKYVYRANHVPQIEAYGTDVTVKFSEDHWEIDSPEETYEIYIAKDDVYLSDMECITSGEVSKDGYFGEKGFTIGGNRWGGERDLKCEKGIAMKAGSRAVYDVSSFDNNTFTAVIGKNTLSNGWQGMSREMFEAEANVVFYLDGQEVSRRDGVSMFGGRSEISIDISNAKELVIEVSGSGRQETQAYEDAVIGNAKIMPRGAEILDASRNGNSASVTVINYDSDEAVVLLTAVMDGKVRASSAKITEGMYRTVELDGVPEGAEVKVYLLGKLNILKEL